MISKKLEKGIRKVTQKTTSHKVGILIGKINELEQQNTELKNCINNLNDRINSLDNYLYKIKNNYNYINLETLELNNFFTRPGNKKILLCGFYGAFNLGDELMLQTLLKKIDNNKNDITIMLCDNQYVDVTKYGKYNFIHYPMNTLDFNYYANYFDVLIFGGGALLDDRGYDDSKHFTLGRILTDLTMRFIVFNKKTILYGLSTNKTISNKEFIKKLDYIVNNCTYFSLRDNNSLKILEENNIDVNKIKIVDDIVFANNFNIEKTNNKNIIKIGIVFICSNDNKNQLKKYLEKIINFLEKKQKDYFISLIPFYTYQNNDINIYNELINEIKNEKIIVKDYPENIEGLEKTFNENDYIISMRYHASLVANVLNKKVLTIIYDKHIHYDNKMNYLYDNYKFEKNTMSFNDDISDTNLELLFDDKKKIEVNNFEERASENIDDMIKRIDN